MPGVVEREVVEGVVEGGEDAGEVQPPTTGALEVEGVAGFAFAPHDGGTCWVAGTICGIVHEGGAVGPGEAVEVGSGEAEAEHGFADAGLAGEDDEEAAGQPAGPVPADGLEGFAESGPGGAKGRWLGIGVAFRPGWVLSGPCAVLGALVFVVGGHGPMIAYGTYVRK